LPYLFNEEKVKKPKIDPTDPLAAYKSIDRIVVQ
jgi:preprotein translocase subunit Sec61beta